MEPANLAVAIAGVLVSAFATYLTYLQVRRSRRPRAPAPAPPPGRPANGHYHAFISYTQADLAHARRIAERLAAEGLRVFLREWIAPGLVEAEAKEQALLGSANGILIFSHATMGDAAIRDDYAALLRHAHTGPHLFVPVRVDDIELPPFAAIRRPVDLTGATPAEYAARLDPLVQVLRATPPGHRPLST
jgi:TIR domain